MGHPWEEIPEQAVTAALEEIYQNPEPTTGADVEAALKAAMPYLKFAPEGDNHHNARLCPYCSPHRAEALEELVRQAMGSGVAYFSANWTTFAKDVSLPEGFADWPSRFLAARTDLTERL